MKAPAPDRVALVHPDLPGRVITVHRRAVAAHRASGWQRLKSPAKAVEPMAPTSAAVNPQGEPK